MLRPFAALLFVASVAACRGPTASAKTLATGLHQDSIDDPLAVVLEPPRPGSVGMLPGGRAQAVALAKRCAQHLAGDTYRCESLGWHILETEIVCPSELRPETTSQACLAWGERTAVLEELFAVSAKCDEARGALERRDFAGARAKSWPWARMGVPCAVEIGREVDRLDPLPRREPEAQPPADDLRLRPTGVRSQDQDSPTPRWANDPGRG